MVIDCKSHYNTQRKSSSYFYKSLGERDSRSDRNERGTRALLNPPSSPCPSPGLVSLLFYVALRLVLSFALDLDLEGSNICNSTNQIPCERVCWVPFVLVASIACFFHLFSSSVCRMYVSRKKYGVTGICIAFQTKPGLAIDARGAGSFANMRLFGFFLRAESRNDDRCNQVTS